MVILALAGLWALLFGRIAITGSLALEGRRARWYGLALLVASLVYGVLGGLVGGVIASVAPSLAANGILVTIARVGLIAAIIVGLVPLFREKPAGTIISVTKS
jgi:hypothetical protein